LKLATGLNIWISVISIGVICTFYSSAVCYLNEKNINSLCNDLNLEGGMKAVIWTDVLQTVVILVGLLATIVQGFIELGGIKQTFLIAYQGNRIQLDRYVEIL